MDAERASSPAISGEAKQLTCEDYVNCPEPVSGAQTATGQPYYSDSRMRLLELHPGPVSVPAVTQIASKLP